jgi:hypothetical protein
VCLLTREHVHPQDDRDGALDALTLSSAVAAKLRVLDVSCCRYLRSIDVVRSCVKLRCLSMPGCDNVSDLSPLAACSETLEELWMADNEQIDSLAPLKACTRLRKLDLRDCYYELRDQVADLRLACTQLADPASVMIVGLVHELQPSIPPVMQACAAYSLRDMIEGGIEARISIAAAGAIPALVQLLRPGPLGTMQAHVHAAAASALSSLAADHTPNQSAISAAGAVPLLVQLQGSTDVRVRANATLALQHLAAFRA